MRTNLCRSQHSGYRHIWDETDKEFIKTLEENIRKRGAMDKLISDRALSEINKKIHDILRAYIINDWQSEPHHQHQNYAERHYAIMKSRTYVILNRTGAPPDTWLLCMQYVCYIFNHMSVESLHWKTPWQLLTGETSDISLLLHFTFNEKIFYTRVNSSFPSTSTEAKGYFVGFGESVGDAMTFKVLTDDTSKIIYRSNVRTALNPNTPNLRLMIDGEQTTFIKSKSEEIEAKLPSLKTLPTFHPKDLIGRSFLSSPTEDGQTLRMRITKTIADQKSDLDQKRSNSS
jgi:hypothetical protein